MGAYNTKVLTEKKNQSNQTQQPHEDLKELQEWLFAEGENSLQESDGTHNAANRQRFQCYLDCC